MEEVRINIENRKKNPDVFFDVLVVEKIEHVDKVSAYSLVTIMLDGRDLRIKFEWKEDTEIAESDFLYVPETNTLFFSTENQWGAIDMENSVLIRHERSMWSPLISRKGDYLLIEDDLKAESTKLNGEKIDAVPIDPPTESQEFEDRIEYNSPVFGKQVLKVR